MRPIDDPLPAPKRLVALGLAGCLAAAGAAAAQTVQKCIAGDGAVTFTSDACAGGVTGSSVPDSSSAAAALFNGVCRSSSTTPLGQSLPYFSTYFF